MFCFENTIKQQLKTGVAARRTSTGKSDLGPRGFEDEAVGGVLFPPLPSMRAGLGKPHSAPDVLAQAPVLVQALP